MDQNSVTTLLISHLKCFQKDGDQAGCHYFLLNRHAKTKHRPDRSVTHQLRALVGAVRALVQQTKIANPHKAKLKVSQ